MIYDSDYSGKRSVTTPLVEEVEATMSQSKFDEQNLLKIIKEVKPSEKRALMILFEDAYNPSGELLTQYKEWHDNLLNTIIQASLPYERKRVHEIYTGRFGAGVLTPLIIDFANYTQANLDQFIKLLRPKPLAPKINKALQRVK